MRTPLAVPTSNSTVSEINGETETYRCYDCSVNFTSEHYLLNHLLHHIKQPSIRISALQKAPIKLTFKTKSNNSFEIVHSPSTTEYSSDADDSAAHSHIGSESNLEEITTEDLDLFADENVGMVSDAELGDAGDVNHLNGLDDVTNVMFSPNYACGTVGDSPAPSDGSYTDMTSPQTLGLNHENSTNLENMNGGDIIPGAEPTPPPESPSHTTEFPKIRIKTTGLLKEPLTITEITDENPNGDYDSSSEIIELSNANTSNNHATNFWSSSLLEDPLKLPDSENILTNFLNNTDHVSDNEFISLDRLDDRNSTALQVYNPSNSAISTLDNLTGLPMQQLAEQVSRLQPSGNNTMHQQNVLINIQQFPQAPPQPNYQHQTMYPPHPGMPAQPPPPPIYQHQPYQYQPNPMYYPPAPNYPPAPHMPPPPPQMQQNSPQQGMLPPPPPPPQQQQQYRQPMPPPRPPACAPPRPYGPQTPRGPAPRQPNFQPRQRAPMVRPRGGPIVPGVRGPRPRMPGAGSVNMQNNNSQQRMIKRSSDQMQDLQSKKKRMDVLVPDSNDDADCQVIAVQPKNTDGGLPQIQSVQGGTPEPNDNIMHLSDSITLSVRNPPPKQESPKKSDAKVVANILATRGITVTATAKPKSSPTKDGSQSPSVAINLNSGAVSIIPTAKGNSPTPTCKQNDPKLQTVDLTDDNIPDPPRNNVARQLINSPQKGRPNTALPFRCDLCPAQYRTAQELNKHRQSYHNTGSPCEIGIPLIDFKQPGIVQKLTSLGIYNFIPLPNSAPNGNYALPVVSVNAAKNSSVCNLAALGASSILTLGPVRSLPKPSINNNKNVPVAKQQ